MGVVAQIDRAVPLLPEHKLALLATFTTVIRATVKGNLVVALVQGRSAAWPSGPRGSAPPCWRLC